MASGAAEGVTLDIVERRRASHIGGVTEGLRPVDIGDKAK
jgi:hypothetical protein